MAKRTAERQLTQLNQHDDEDTDVQGSNFQKADEGELARRVIRKPKSRLRSAASNESTPKASFSGFAGFGATSSNVSEGSGSEQPKSSFTGFSFGQSSNATEKDTPAFGAGNAVKAGGFGSSGFGSSGFGSSGVTASATPAFGSSGTTASATPAFGSSGTTTATPAFGSGGFGAKPSAATDKPASAGFSFGATPSTTTDKPSGFSFGTQSSGFTFGKPAEPEKPAPSEPAKPTASTFSFGAFKPPTATAPSTASTGIFGKTSAQPSFKSGFVPPTSASTVPAAAEPTKSSSDDEFYRHIRGLNTSIQKKIADAIAVNAFVDLTPLLEQYRKHWKKVTEDFMPDTGAAVDTGKPAETAPVVSKAKEAAPVVSNAKETAPVVSKAAEPAPKKSSMFASLSPSTQPSKSAEPTKFAFGAQSAISATSPKPAETKFAFGAQSTSSSTSPKPAQGSPGGFSFNFNKPTPTTDATKKPFSFGFGKPTDTASSPPKPAFSFGLSKPVQSPTIDAGPLTGTSATDAQSDDEQEPDTARAPTTAGEEGETTVHKVRGKVYMWDSEKKAFKDLGVGNLRINTWETDGGDKRARVLCRQETTEKITLNASMFAKMMVEHKGNDKNVGLLAVVDAKPTRFMFRVKTTGEASELKKALDNVIASL
ncbi:hypothetical protein J3B01_002865 [Coemansia erecta]|nr:hypothetical protein J3B01_002865 [Coemansia erecta]